MPIGRGCCAKSPGPVNAAIRGFSKSGKRPHRSLLGHTADLAKAAGRLDGACGSGRRIPACPRRNGPLFLLCANSREGGQHEDVRGGRTPRVRRGSRDRARRADVGRQIINLFQVSAAPGIHRQNHRLEPGVLTSRARILLPFVCCDWTSGAES